MLPSSLAAGAGRPSPPDLRRLARAAAVVRVGIAAIGLAVAGPMIDSMADDLRDSGRRASTIPLFGPADGLGLLVSAGGFAALALSVVVTWRLVRTGEWLGRRDPRWAAGWALGGWVIPLGSAVIPVLQLGELWQATDAEVPPHEARWRDLGERTRVVPFAIAASVVQTVVSTVFGIAVALAYGNRNRVEGAATLRDMKGWVLAGSVVGFAASCLVAWLLVRLADRQHAALARHRAHLRPPARAHGPAPAGGPAWPAGWYPDPYGRFPARWWNGWAWDAAVWTGTAAAHDPPPAPQPGG